MKCTILRHTKQIVYGIFWLCVNFLNFAPIIFSDLIDEFDKPFDDIALPTKRARLDFIREDGFMLVYTDGACENNGKPNAKAGIGVWFGDNHPLYVF